MLKAAKIGLIILATAFGSSAAAQEIKPLSEYIEEAGNIGKAEYLYITMRCGALYMHAASVTQKNPELFGKFEEAALLSTFYASKLKAEIDNISPEKAQDLIIPLIGQMFDAIKAKAEKNWALTGMYSDDIYMQDMQLCNATLED